MDNYQELRAGYTLFEDEDGNEWWWKDCEVPGCENQVCVNMSDRFCWPHAMSGGERRLVTGKRKSKAPMECEDSNT